MATPRPLGGPIVRHSSLVGRSANAPRVNGVDEFQEVSPVARRREVSSGCAGVVVAEEVGLVEVGEESTMV